MGEIFELIEEKAKQMGLSINQEKTKYMQLTQQGRYRQLGNISIGNYNFEEVDSFTYLGSEINSLNKTQRTQEREVKSILEAQMEGKRRRGRARSRWLDDVREDLQTLGVVAWRTVVQDRDK